LKSQLEQSKKEITDQYEADPGAAQTSHTWAVFKGMIDKYRNMMFNIKNLMD
jgi:hypothetical protein